MAPEIQRFRDRYEAGRRLAGKLDRYKGQANVIVLGLARGGVPVAYEVAKSLGAPLDVFVVRKLGAPGHEELAMGAIATGGVRVLNMTVIRQLGIDEEFIEAAAIRETRELERREKLYRSDRAPLSMKDRTVILIDDGLATGTSMRVAITVARQQAAARVVVGVPVGAAETHRELLTEADDVHCVVMPADFYAVGLWYENFEQTSDEEVRDLLQRSEAHV